MAEMLFDPEPDPDDESDAVGADGTAGVVGSGRPDVSLHDVVSVLSTMPDLDADGVLAEAGLVQTLVNLAQARQLRLACAWADANSELDPSQSAGLPGMERLVELGGAGTPTIAEFAPAELAAQVAMSPVAGGYLIGDALDLRHRLPKLWELVCAGGVRVFAARKIAAATRHLSMVAAAKVDVTAARYASRVGWGRLQALVEAAVIAADPAAGKERAQAARDGLGGVGQPRPRGRHQDAVRPGCGAGPGRLRRPRHPDRRHARGVRRH